MSVRTRRANPRDDFARAAAAYRERARWEREQYERRWADMLRRAEQLEARVLDE